MFSLCRFPRRGLARAASALAAALPALALSACAVPAREASPAAATASSPLATGAAAPASASAPSAGKRMAGLEYSGPEPHVKLLLASDRLVARSGSIRLRASGNGARIDSAIALARAFGGASEVRREDWVLLTVPAASFDRAFGALMALGEVLHYSQQAENLSEEYARMGKRQQALDSLAPADSTSRTAPSRAARIHRAERESLEAGKQALRKRADFARITVNVEGPLPP